MGAKLSKDEKEYIESNAAASYLLLKHDPSRGIDCFNVYDQGENKEYSINVIGEYRRSGTESPTLVIYDDVGAAVGTMRWNNESPASNPFKVRCVNDSGKIEIEYGEKKLIFRKSWYQPSFSDWTLDYRTVFWGNGNRCAEISSISNYKRVFWREIKVRDSYLINRY